MLTRRSVRERQGHRSILEIAQFVHSAVCGSGDWYPTIDQDVQLITDVLTTWESPTSDWDGSVRSLLESTVIEYSSWKGKREAERNSNKRSCDDSSTHAHQAPPTESGG